MKKFCCRVGRTARAGRGGVSVSLAGEQERVLVKEVIKQAKNPVKNRIIPPDIIEKYNKKLHSLEPDVEKILEEERQERELARVENQANRMQNMLLNDDNKDQRTWFQTPKERQQEKSEYLNCINSIVSIVKVMIILYIYFHFKFIFRKIVINGKIWKR